MMAGRQLTYIVVPARDKAWAIAFSAGAIAGNFLLILVRG